MYTTPGNRFLNSGNSGFINNGTVDLIVNTAVVNNLAPSQLVATDSNKMLTSVPFPNTRTAMASMQFGGTTFLIPNNSGGPVNMVFNQTNSVENITVTSFTTFTVEIEGNYYIQASMTGSGTTAVGAPYVVGFMYIYINDTQYTVQEFLSFGPGSVYTLANPNVSCIAPLAIGDVVALAYHTTGTITPCDLRITGSNLLMVLMSQPGSFAQQQLDEIEAVILNLTGIAISNTLTLQVQLNQIEAVILSLTSINIVNTNPIQTQLDQIETVIFNLTGIIIS